MGARPRSARVTRMNLRAFTMSLAVVPAIAFGHAVVTPADSGLSQTQQYTLHVPNEKDVPTVAVELLFPAEIDVTTVDEQEGWQLLLTRDSKRRITSATWMGSLAPKTSARPVSVAWNVVQTYDGVIVEWTGEPGSKTPASRTNIH